MLRLHVSCGLIPPAKTSNIGKNYKSSVLQFPGVRWVCAKALREEANGGGSGFVGRNWDPGLEVEVPFEQRPVNEYSSLKDGPLYSWGELSPGPFFLRIGGLWLVTFTVLGIPIAAASFNPSREPLRFLLAAGTGTLFLVALVVLRIYLVKPVIKLLKQTLVGTGGLLVTAVLLFIFASPVENIFQNIFSNVPNSTSSAKSNISKEELLRLPKEVMGDDDLAAAAAEAADGRPVYCRDRYYRALAGGQYCKWEDLVN
ncbi:hypothetical protein AQUCO_04200106v1 [Aquilegia coerulea]|uniref:Uncharacterized protein n=1 Tax=Aquilegia coerulea TaxID=218851 RepID=A0A2G5CP90_AQUCA|nr:hypothetical protein AQUCO_04200106v1 [Aquilegia coerulea]